MKILVISHKRSRPNIIIFPTEPMKTVLNETAVQDLKDIFPS